MVPYHDLPAEILEQILIFVSPGDLVFRIAKVDDYKLRYLALREFFKRYNVIQPEGIDIGGGLISTILYALHRATWIKDVPSLTIRVDSSMGYTETICDEVLTLARFIRRLETLGTLNIYITNTRYPVFQGMSTEAQLSTEEKLRSGNSWRKCFGALLSVALSKGIDGLHIFGPDSELMPGRIDLSNQPPLPKSWRRQNWVVKRAIGLYSYVLPGARPNQELMKSIIRLRHSRSTNAWGEARLKDIQLSSMLLAPLFFWDTIGLLSAHAHTIHTLNFHEVCLDFSHNAQWEVLLTQIQFPLLEHFTFTGPPDRGFRASLIPFDNLFSFLDRHPKITYLQLTNMTWGDDPESEEGIPYLPNLKFLIAHNYLAACILQRPENCKHLQRLRLCSQSPIFCYNASSCLPGCNVALAAIASHTRHAVEIELDLENATDIGSWMSGEKTPRSLEIARGLIRVHDITIFWGMSHLFHKDSRGALLTVLPNWLGSFPSLERLCIYVIGFDELALRAAIRNSCPHLKSCRINNVL